VHAPGTGDPYNADALSYLQGQRLSSCTCPGESHPGPKKPDGTYTARSAPEIDLFEATVGGGVGTMSQSCQWAPFDSDYAWKNGTGDVAVYNNATTRLNNYRGGAYQEATSGLTTTDQTAYQMGGGNFAIYGFEYEPGPAGYVTWVTDGKPAWTLFSSAIGPNPITNISQRSIPQEPMYIMLNQGISTAFGPISPKVTYPNIMLVDYVRVYQDPNSRNIGCNPDAYPTEDYINQYIEAYTNPNLTTWALDYGQPVPKNRLVDTCD